MANQIDFPDLRLKFTIKVWVYLHGRDLLSVPVDASGRVAGEERKSDLEAHRQQVGPGKYIGRTLKQSKSYFIYNFKINKVIVQGFCLKYR